MAISRREAQSKFKKVAAVLLAMVSAICLIGPATAGEVSVVNQAPYSGTYGLRVSLTDANPAYVRDNTPFAESRYRMRIYFRTDSLVVQEGSGLDFFSANNSGDVAQFRLSFEQTGGTLLLRASAREDSGSMVEAPGGASLGSGYHALEIDWQQGAGTGSLALWLDGERIPGLSGLDNDMAQVEYVMLGAISGMGPGVSGFFDLDDFISQRVCYVGLLGCDAGCQYGESRADWPAPVSVSDLIYFLNDPCYP